MASITFSPGTVIPSTWLNDVNVAVYNTLPTLAPKISPVFTTPTLGVATATSINKNYFTQPANNCTWTLADGKTLNVSNTLTFSGTDGASLALGSGANSFSGTTSGTNTGDQLTYKTVKVSGQPDVIAGTTADNLTLVAGAGITLTTDNTAKSVTVNSTSTPGLVLLSQATISTPVANVDFLNVFNSTYDNYLVIVNNLRTSSTSTYQGLAMLVATGGVVDNSASRYSAPGTNGTAITMQNNSISLGELSPVGNADYLMTGQLYIDFKGVNAAQGGKVVSVKGFNHVYVNQECVYGTSASTPALTGFRLYQTTGATFSAGTIRVYGIRNT